MTATPLLDRTRELLAERKNWTQLVARAPRPDGSVALCLRSAVAQAATVEAMVQLRPELTSWHIHHEFLALLQVVRARGYADVVAFNDDYSTRHTDVLAVIEEAKELVTRC